MRPFAMPGPSPAALALLLLFCGAAGVRGSTLHPGQETGAGQAPMGAAAEGVASAAGPTVTPDALDSPEGKACL